MNNYQYPQPNAFWCFFWIGHICHKHPKTRKKTSKTTRNLQNSPPGTSKTHQEPLKTTKNRGGTGPCKISPPKHPPNIKAPLSPWQDVLGRGNAHRRCGHDPPREAVLLADKPPLKATWQATARRVLVGSGRWTKPQHPKIWEIHGNLFSACMTRRIPGVCSDFHLEGAISALIHRKVSLQLAASQRISKVFLRTSDHPAVAKGRKTNHPLLNCYPVRHRSDTAHSRRLLKVVEF